MKKIFITLTIAALGTNVFAQNVDKLIKEKDVSRIIATLTADSMQGRKTFTPGIEKAAQFIEGEFKQIGLDPLPGNADFRQNIKMTRLLPVNNKATINGIAVAPNVTAASASTAFNWTNDMPVEIVNIAAGQNLNTEVQKIRRSGKKTLVTVDSSFAQLFKRMQMGLSRGTTVYSNAAPASNNAQLFFVLGNYGEVKTFNVSTEIKSESLPPLFNIAGMIKGKTKPDEYVIFSGHYDHLGVIKPVEGDSIANGADDDASGTTAVITLAKYYKKINSNNRSIIFVAFTAEEIGGYGSTYFTTQVNPEKTVAMFNIEMIGKASKFGENSAFITGYERTDFGPILQKNLTDTKFKFYPDPYPEQNLFYRSDNASLARLGVPAHTISTDQIPDDKFYHTVKDELSTLDVKNITATIKAIALSSKTIVAGTDTPTRIPAGTVN